MAGVGEAEHALLVALLDRIVLNVGRLPDGGDLRIGRNSKLSHEAFHHAEEAGVGKEAILDQVIESVSRDGGPIAMYLDQDIALGGDELHAKQFRSLGL